MFQPSTICKGESGTKIIPFTYGFTTFVREEVYRLLLCRIPSDVFQNIPFCSAEQGLQGHTLLAAAAPNPPLQHPQQFPPTSRPIFRGNGQKKTQPFEK